MKKVCMVCESDIIRDPRPRRLIEVLKGKYRITAIGLEATEINGVEVLSYPYAKKRNAKEEQELENNVAKKDYMKLVRIPNRLVIEKYLQEREFDIIFCHDLLLLPFVVENKKEAKIIFDAREYYPRQMESNERWKRLFAGFNDYLCKTYLKQVDYMYSVSEGIAKEYEKNYGVKCDVITSAAKYYAPPPPLICHEPIKLIYHGMASKERGIEKMIEIMEYLDSRFTLDLMLVKTADEEYYKNLESQVSQVKNTRIIPIVPFEEIIPFTSQYDIGFYILQPTNFNGYNALPNKFFEFIQARLAIAIGPSPEMAKLVQQYHLGIISKDFTPKSMAESLNKLTKEEILQYKENSNKAAKILNAQNEGEKLLKIVEEVLG
ncbi:hypothetical protein [Helicobacter pullorum]|nr:hypothetical protein [Helicobacter pullorum]